MVNEIKLDAECLGMQDQFERVVLLGNQLLTTLNLLEKPWTFETHVSQIQYTNLNFIDYMFIPTFREETPSANEKPTLFTFKENKLIEACSDMAR